MAQRRWQPLEAPATNPTAAGIGKPDLPPEGQFSGDAGSTPAGYNPSQVRLWSNGTMPGIKCVARRVAPGSRKEATGHAPTPNLLLTKPKLGVGHGPGLILLMRDDLPELPELQSLLHRRLD